MASVILDKPPELWSSLWHMTLCCRPFPVARKEARGSHLWFGDLDLALAPSHHHKPSVSERGCDGAGWLPGVLPSFSGGSSLGLLGKHFTVVAKTSGNQKMVSNLWPRWFPFMIKEQHFGVLHIPVAPLSSVDSCDSSNSTTPAFIQCLHGSW